MRKRFMQKAFLLLAIPFIHFSYMMSIDWTNGDVITPAQNNVDTDFNVNGDIYVSGRVLIHADTKDVVMNNITQKTTFTPFPGDGEEPAATLAHMIFKTSDENRKIEVICDYDLIWKSYNAQGINMIVTFEGPGRTIFKLADTPTDCAWRGAQVAFLGDQTGGPNGDIYTSGTKVYILMDQTYDQAIDQGLNKVTFQRKSYLGKELPEGSDQRPYQGYPTGVVIGKASHMTYLSNDDTGNHNEEPTYGTLAFDPTHQGVGRMYLKIDGSIYNPFPTQENGEVVLPTFPSFADGGLMIFGHYVPSYGYPDIEQNLCLNGVAGSPRGAIFRITDEVAYKYNTCAPEETCPSPGTEYTYDPDDDQFRGLLIINSNGTLPKMANDPYQENMLWEETPNTDPSHPNSPRYWGADYSWFKARENQHIQNSQNIPHFNVQPGFIVGHNGKIEIYHKTFLDYVGVRDQTLDFLALQDTSDYYTGAYNTWTTGANVFKTKNPSAFFVDGLDYYSNNQINEEGIEKSPYDAESNAVICFYGNSRALFRAGSWGETCLGEEYCEYNDLCLQCDRNCHKLEGEPIIPPMSENIPTRTPGDILSFGYGPWAMKLCDKVTWVYTFTDDQQAYNRQYIPSNKHASYEGRNVIDIEGPVESRSFGRGEAPGRGTGGTDSGGSDNYVEAITTEMGEINLPTVSIDHTGRETLDVFSEPREYIQRPLVENQMYEVYDSPSVFFNDTLELYDIIYNHNDITKALTANPNNADPNWVGGERKFFGETIFPENSTDPNRKEHYELPKVRPFNSIIEMHEHFVNSGIRWDVREQSQDIEKELVFGENANNCSIFKFFDHGDYLDTLDHAYGRLFMCTCGHNYWSDGSTNVAGESCPINIYRSQNIQDPETPADTINLSLESLDEPNISRVPLIDPNERQRAHHLFLMQRAFKGKSFMEIGWVTPYGDSGHYPWERETPNPSNEFSINTTEPDEETPTNTPPATLSIDGNYFYFGGTDWIGNKAVMPVSTEMMGSVIYVNHGGRITITQPGAETCDGEGLPKCDRDHGYDAFFDLPLAYRLWCYEGLRGTIDLPKDQVTYGYGFGRQPYDIDNNTTDECGPVAVHVDTYNKQVNGSVANSIRTSADRHSGEEVVIPWRWRKYDVLGDGGFENSIVKSIVEHKQEEVPTRFTGIIDKTVSLPDNVLYFGAGDGWADIVTQLRITGATLADPLHLLIDGWDEGHGYARIYEITSQASNPAIHGEGQHGILFLKNGGRIGLGSRDWNEHSKNAWNQLGKDFVTIAPMGNGTVDLNSDVYVNDNGAFVAGDTFAEGEAQRLTINLNGNDLYIPAGGTLDLSSFGQNNYRQEIEFAGEGRVIFGPGATIRFPNIPQGVFASPSGPEDYPVLYFNDNTQLVFLGDFEKNKGRFATLADADVDKIKILGCGQIWLNKNGRCEINGNAAVRVGSDTETPFTYVRVSIQRQGDFVIGTEQESGGSLEIGNIEQVYECTEGEDSAVNFELILNGEKARFHMDRGAFLGFGVGVVDKSNDIMNGDSTLENNPSISAEGQADFCPSASGWQLAKLYDVHKIIIDNEKGIIDHSNIFAGNDRKAHLIAVGPVKSYQEEEGFYFMKLADPDRSLVLGGGNIIHFDPTEVRDVCEEAPKENVYVNAWDYADAEPRDYTYDMYNILASSMILLQWKPEDFTNSTLSQLRGGAIQIVTGAGNSRDFFKFLSFPNVASQYPAKFVDAGSTEYLTYIAYVSASSNETGYPVDQIFRFSGIPIIGEGYPEDGVGVGVLGAQITPAGLNFNVVRRR